MRIQRPTKTTSVFHLHTYHGGAARIAFAHSRSPARGSGPLGWRAPLRTVTNKHINKACAETHAHAPLQTTIAQTVPQRIRYILGTGCRDDIG